MRFIGALIMLAGIAVVAIPWVAPELLKDVPDEILQMVWQTFERSLMVGGGMLVCGFLLRLLAPRRSAGVHILVG